MACPGDERGPQDGGRGRRPPRDHRRDDRPDRPQRRATRRAACARRFVSRPAHWAVISAPREGRRGLRRRCIVRGRSATTPRHRRDVDPCDRDARSPQTIGLHTPVLSGGLARMTRMLRPPHVPAPTGCARELARVTRWCSPNRRTLRHGRPRRTRRSPHLFARCGSRHRQEAAGAHRARSVRRGDRRRPCRRGRRRRRPAHRYGGVVGSPARGCPRWTGRGGRRDRSTAVRRDAHLPRHVTTTR